MAVLIKGHQYGWGIGTLVYGLRTYFVYGLGMTYLGLPPGLINITLTLKNIFDNVFVEHGGLHHVFPLAVHLVLCAEWIDRGRGSFSDFLLFMCIDWRPYNTCLEFRG